MISGSITSRSAEAIDQLDRLRCFLAETTAPPQGWPAAVRSALEPLQSDEYPIDAEALRRLLLMCEVWECLDPDDAETCGRLAPFFEEAIGRLTSELRQGEPDEATNWILRESEAQWGTYLALLDPSIGPLDTPDSSLSAVVDPVAEVDPPAINAADLLRMLSGDNSRPEPASPAPPVESDGNAHSTHERLNANSTDPIATGADSLAKPAAPDVAPNQASDTDTDALTEARQIDLDPELRSILTADVSDLFSRIQELVLALGNGDESGRLLELGRCFHTLKGAAGSVGLGTLAAIIHELEDELESAGDRAGASLVERLESVLSLLEGVINALNKGKGEAATPGTSGSTEACSVVSSAAGSSEGARTDEEPQAADADGLIRMPAARFEELVDLCSELLTKRRAWADQAVSMKHLAHSARDCSHRLRGSVDRLSDAIPGHLAEPGFPKRSTDDDPVRSSEG